MRSRREDGFTLLEAMTVVVIVLLLAAIAAPSLGNARRERATHEAALEIVRVLRQARSESVAFGRAHLARYSEDFDADNGGIEIYRGVSNGCFANDWVMITQAGCLDNEMCRADVMMSNHIGGGEQWRLDLTTASADLDLCFEPSGRTLWRTAPAGTFTDQNLAGINGGTVFTIQRFDEGGNPEGVARRVAMPFGSDARLLR